MIPDVAGLRRDLITRAGRPYLERFHILESRRLSVRFHHFIADDPADLHDHPWPFTSLILDGWILEETETGCRMLEPGAVVTHKATDAHRYELQTPDAWTYFVAGPVCRRWGFRTEHGWIRWDQYPGAGEYLEADR